MIFFSFVTPHVTRQARNTLAGSQLGKSKGITIDQAITMCCARMPLAPELRLHHPCHREIRSFCEIRKMPSLFWRSFSLGAAYVGDFLKGKASVQLSTKFCVLISFFVRDMETFADVFLVL